MWIEEIKDSPIAREIAKVVYRDEIEDKGKRILANLLTKHAEKLGLNIQDDTENLLMIYCDEPTLFEMANNMENMTDFGEFVRSHGINLPGYDR